MSTAFDIINYSSTTTCLRALCKTLSKSKKYHLIDGRIDRIEYRFLDGSGIVFDKNGIPAKCHDILHFVDEFV